MHDFYSRSRLTIILGICCGVLTTAVCAEDKNKTDIQTKNKTDIQTVSSNLPAALFKSRFPVDESGKHDLTELNQCRSRANGSGEPLSEKLVPNLSLTQRHFSFQSAPLISSTLTHLKGDVKAQDANSLIRADEVKIDYQNNLLSALGSVSIESEKTYFTADSLTQNSASEAHLENAYFYLFSNNANGTAAQVLLNAETETELKQLTFSTCPKGKETWQFSTEQMNIDHQQGWGEAWHTLLRVKGVPVFYLPYINFPTDDRRKSGLLSPSISNDNQNGLDLRFPIYWNIAPEMDATLSFGEIEKRGHWLGVEFRWLTENSHSEWAFEGIDKDKIVANTLAEAVAAQTEQHLATDNIVVDNLAKDSQRWFSQFDYQARIGESWRFNLEHLRVSDFDYFRDFGSGIETSQETQLTSQSHLTYQDEIWQLDVFSIVHQSLIGQSAYRILPGIDLSADYFDEQSFNWHMHADVERFRHPEVGQIEADRFNLQPSVSYPMNNSWGFAIPKLSYQSTYYQFREQQQQGTDPVDTNQLTANAKESLSRNLPSFSFDSGVYFDRDTQWKEKEIRHSLSPRLFYVLIPHRNQQHINLFDASQSVDDFQKLWQENRFTGIDRVGDTNHLSLAIDNRFSEKASSQQLFRFQLGRQFHFDKPSINLSGENVNSKRRSPWLAEMSFQLDKSLEFEGFIEWDPAEKKSLQANSRIKFEPKGNHIVNLSHKYRSLQTLQENLTGQIEERAREEIDISFAWPINDKWRLVGRWYNDLQQRQVIESFIGLEYESCCWAIRLIGHKYLQAPYQSALYTSGFGDPALDYSQGLKLQFVFKGLGSAGESSLSQMLESGIRGYQDPFLN